MTRLVSTLILLAVVLCINAKTDADSIATCDTTTISADTVKHKKQSFFKRAYYFLDRIFSPPRDSAYIDVQDYNWCGELQLTNRYEMYEIDNGDDFKLRVAPRIRTRVGPFFGWRFAFFGYNIDLKSIFFNNDDIDIAGSIYSSAFGLDLFYRRVGGNYNIQRLKFNDVNFSGLMKNVPFDGINVGMTRINFYYVTNYKKYSHQAAFSQTNRQLKSAGSLLLGAAYAHNRIVVDWEKLVNMVNERCNTSLTATAITDYQKNNELTFTAGYGYNWVFARNWLAAGEITGGIGILFHHADSKAPESSKNIFKYLDNFAKSNLAFNGNIRLALLWNNGPLFCGLQGVMFYYQYGNGKVINRNILGTTYALVGINF